MAEPATTTPAAAPATHQPAPGASLSEINSAHLQARADRLSAAMAKALVDKAKGQAAPKSSPKPGSGATMPSAQTEATPVPAVAELASLESEPSADPVSVPAESEPEALAPELTELQELGKKKDLRALEKKLGLEEGSLGVRNAEYALYRRRIEEADARDAEHAKNQQAIIAKFGEPAALIESARKGDLKAYAATIERTTGVAIDKFIEFWAKNVQQLDPATIELQRENERLRARLGAPPPETKPAGAVTAQAATEKADKYIAEEAGQHPAFKLEGAKEGVRKLWLESYDKATKGFKLTPQQAAAQFVTQRRAAYEKEQWILSGKKAPDVKRTKALSRQGASESQPRKETLSRAELIDRAAKQWQRLKAQER